jgi:hypothetical protein
MQLLQISGFLTGYGIERGNREHWSRLRRELHSLRHQGDYVRQFRNGREFVRRQRQQREYDFIIDARAYFDDLVGLLAKAAIERINLASPKGNLLEDLRWAKCNLREFLISRSTVSLLAATHIAQNYQRADEPPGTHWYDLEWIAQKPPDGVLPPSAEKVREAADRAEEKIRAEASSSQKRKALTPSIELLAVRLRRWWMRSGNSKPTRKFEDLDLTTGPLLDVVLPALNRLIGSHGGRPFPRPYLVKLMCSSLSKTIPED